MSTGSIVALLAFAAFAQPASAGHVDGAPTTDAGSVSASNNQDSASFTANAGGGSGGTSQTGGGGAGSGGGSGHTITCSYSEYAGDDNDVGPKFSAGAAVAQPVDGGSYVRSCRDETGYVVSSDFQIFHAPTAAPPDPAVLAAELAQQARAELRPETPAIASNPPGGLAVVNIPVWLWVTAWAPLTATVTAGGVTATATATPVSVRWTTDAHHRGVTCNGPGAPYNSSKSPARQSTNCSFTYTEVDQLGDQTITAIETWRVAYTSNVTGADGDLGVITSPPGQLVEHVHQLVTSIVHLPGDSY
jgi:hypothetical protein